MREAALQSADINRPFEGKWLRASLADPVSAAMVSTPTARLPADRTIVGGFENPLLHGRFSDEDVITQICVRFDLTAVLPIA